MKAGLNEGSPEMRSPLSNLCHGPWFEDEEQRTFRLLTRSTCFIWRGMAARTQGHGMVELSMNTVVVQLLLDDIFQLVEQTKDREIRRYQANCAWFQVSGMRRIVSVGADLHTALHGRQEAGNNDEYQQVGHLLDAALEKLERLVDERPVAR